MKHKLITDIRIYLGMVILTCIVGCESVREKSDTAMISVGNQSYARNAWKHQKENHAEIESSRDYGSGFKKGYAKAIQGGNASPPSAPKRYNSSILYKNKNGEYKKQRWFDGYYQGVTAAKNDGYANINYNPLPNRPLHDTHSYDTQLPETQQIAEAITLEKEQEPLLAPASESIEPESLKLAVSTTSPLLPIYSLDSKEIPEFKQKESTTPVNEPATPFTESADFHPLEDDTPELYAAEDLNIEPLKNFKNENRKASSIEIRPASKFQQVSYEEFSSGNSNQNNPSGIQIQPGTYYRQSLQQIPREKQEQQTSREKQEKDEWRMPQE